MIELKYEIEEKVIAQLLGQQNFTNDESAVLELVKNAYDAGATVLEIQFEKDCITLKDNGCGMDEADIRKSWMCVGKSNKGYSTINDGEIRVLAGSKGIGRFALARLGEKIELFSKKEYSNPICWITDWNRTRLIQETDNTQPHGTTIIIQSLREKWSPTKIRGLNEFLGRTYDDTTMKIVIIYQGEKQSVTKYLPEPRLGINCLSIIKLIYDCSKTLLTITVESDEFLNEAQIYCPTIDLKLFQSTVNMFDEFNDDCKRETPELNLEECLKNLGNFSAEFYFSVIPTKKEVEKFLYKHNSLTEPFESGVILYRNAFSISSMEGKKDWLGLGKRSRKSPAAATHPTGAWRVRENQLAGKVFIDKQENVVLQDLSNRQGLEENVYYEFFVKILNVGITEFERYRQSIIRAINRKNIRPKSQPKTHMARAIAQPSYVLTLSEKECKELAKEMASVINDNKFLASNQKEIEGQYRYDVRILNVLATMGLKAFSVAHELKNKRTNIAHNVELIISALKRYSMWETLTTDEFTDVSSRNVPKLLEENRTINNKVVVFMNAVLTNIEKQRFYQKNLNISLALQDICKNWKRDYSFLNFNLDVPQNLSYELPEDILTVIFDNLILNSVQQNDRNKDLNIQIQVTPNSGKLFCRYSDDGVGLTEKYISSPRKILEVHETSRKEGHGLGMWIVNNTCVDSGGEVISIDGTNGFKIEFTIGGIKNHG